MHYLKYILTSILLALVASCSLNEVVLPSWNTSWKIFFNSDKVTMEEVLTEDSLTDSLTVVDGDTLSLIYVSISDSTDPQAIERSDLAFKPDDDQIVKAIGDIELESESQTTEPKSLPQMFPGLPITVGQQVVIPDTTVPIDGVLINFDKYETVDINTGRMYLIFYNDLTVDIDAGMVVTVFNGINEVGSFTFTEGIPQAQQAQSTDLSLNGQSLTSDFILNYSIPIIGTGGQLRTISEADTASNFTTDVYIADLKVNSALAEVPEQRVEEREASDLSSEEDKEIISAKIESGMVHLIITNNINVGANVTIKIPDIVDANGDTLRSFATVPAGVPTNASIDLSDYTIINSESPGSVVDSIDYIVVAKSIPSGEGNFVSVNSLDEIVVDVTMDSIYVSDFTGNIIDMKVDIDPVEEDDLVDLTDLDGAFRLPSLHMDFKFYNEINFDVDLDLTLTAIKEVDGIIVDEDSIKIQQRLFRGSPQQAVVTTYRLDENDDPNETSIVDLLAMFPTIIKISGVAIVSGNPGSVNVGDRIWVEYTMESPLQLQIDEPLVMNMDLDSIPADDLDEKERSDIADNLNDVLINLIFENGLPLGADVKFVMALDTTDIFKLPPDTNRIIVETHLEPGMVDENGLVENPSISQESINLTEQNLQLFKRQDSQGNYLPLFYRTQVTIDSSDALIQFRKSDELKYEGNIEVKYKVDPNE